ncbi:MAG: GlsB/YeaQ/YmgE family stress response membrane protein [Acidobacteriota bacterium]
MGLLITLIIGFIVGALAKWIMPGKDPGGLIVTTLLGIGGAFVGHFLAGIVGIGQGGLLGFAASIGGAVLLLAVYRGITGK